MGQRLVSTVASDGLLTGQADSDGPVRVASKPAQAEIDGPAHVKLFRQGQIIMLAGYAYDAEDGPLADESLAWRALPASTTMWVRRCTYPSF